MKTWDLPHAEHLPDNQPLTHLNTNDVLAEAESALIALGYKPVDAAKMIAAAAKQHADASSQELIRLALRSIASA